MIDFFLKKIKYIITLRFSILTIFVTLFVTAIILIAAINYIYSARTLLVVADKLMQQTSRNLHNEFTNQIKRAMRDNEISAILVQQNLLNSKSTSEMMNYTVDIANKFYIAQATYWGDENGSIVDAEYLPDNSVMSEIIDRSKIPYTRKLIYRNIDGTIIKEVNPTEINFDPRKRPWYIQAKEAKKTILTKIYKFTANKLLGVTFATPVYDKNGKLRGVFGIDISLDWISWYINEQKLTKNEVVFLITTDGKIIAGSRQLKNDILKNIKTLDAAGLAKSFNVYKTTHKGRFKFEFEGDTYLANYKIIPQLSDQKLIIGIVIPEDDFIGNLKKGSLIVIGSSLIVLLLSILLVSKFITQVVVKPIKKLVKKTEKIKRFELDGEENIKSRIKEVILLADAIKSMVSGLKSFQKYVPVTLVRQLLLARDTASIGGSKKYLAILFTDIKNFTSLSENMDPDELLKNMCDYFDELSKIITTEKGTIDKYIGDSIMAFWGAPLPVNNPSQLAASAALKCRRRLQELNSEWKKQGKSPLITRFGIHIGDVVVGNIGSTERINYTVIGDATNVASRLEGLNKIYGTSIIVSDAIYQILKDQFVLRKIDSVNMKGKIINNDVYELLAENKNELSFNIDHYKEVFDQGIDAYKKRSWDQAIIYFDNCLKIYPADTIARVFLKRCKRFKKTPPLKTWDGTWHTKK